MINLELKIHIYILPKILKISIPGKNTDSFIPIIQIRLVVISSCANINSYWDEKE